MRAGGGPVVVGPFVHRGTIEFCFGEDDRRTLGEGSFARVDAATVRSLRNVSEEAEAVYLCVGGAGGYVGRDGLLPKDEATARTDPA